MQVSHHEEQMAAGIKSYLYFWLVISHYGLMLEAITTKDFYQPEAGGQDLAEGDDATSAVTLPGQIDIYNQPWHHVYVS